MPSVQMRGDRFREWTGVGRRRDLLALGFIVALALCYLAPAFSSGPSFGPADLGRGLSLLTSVAHSNVHNNINGDIIDQSVAWNTLNYTLVHHGQFPLWNGYAGNGLPQFLNFESGVLALPSLFGYLVPLSWSFTIIVLVKLLIAGLGTYWAARLLGLGVLPATFAGATFMLSGGFANWLGWSISGVFCWTGVILAGAVMCVRSRRSIAPVATLAVAVAFAIYGGFPEGYVLLGGTIAFVLGVAGLVARLGGLRMGLRPALRLGAGGALGLGLSAPLWLPGLPIVRSSIRAGADTSSGLPIHGILLALAQGYDGLPTRGSVFFLGRTNYYESAAYIGIIALVCAGIAVGTRIFSRSNRSAMVVALAVTAFVQVLVIYQFGTHAPVQHLVRAIGLGSVSTHRLLPLLGFVVALLGAYGLRELFDTKNTRARDLAFLCSSAVVLLVLGYMWLTVPDAAHSSCTGAQPAGVGMSASACEAIRRTSLYGPSAISIALVLVALAFNRERIAGALLMRKLPAATRSRSGRSTAMLASALLVAQSLSLVFAGVEVNTYSATNYPKTPAVDELAKLVKGTLVGQDGLNATCPATVTSPCGVRAPTGVDFYPNINVGYGIDELGMHDPIIPKRTFTDWPVNDAGQLLAATNLFNPDVDSVALARDYGVSFVLARTSTAPPRGMSLVARLANNGVVLDLYRVPGSEMVMSSTGARVDGVSDSGNGRVSATLSGAGPVTVTAHITDVPGWHASIDGRSIPIVRGPTNDMVLHIPAGTFVNGQGVLTITYLPRDLLLGIGFAALSIVVLVALLGLESRTGRKMSRKAASPVATSW